MLPLTVLRRLDCVLEPTKDQVLARANKLEGGKLKNVEPVLCRITGAPFCITSRYTFEKLKGDPNNIAANLTNYIKGFSIRAREIIERFGFEEHIARLDKADRLYLSSPASARSICTPTASRTSRWATSSRSSSGGSTRPPTRKPATTSRRARSSA